MLKKTALITGAGGGIGQAISVKLYKEGIHLILVDKDATALTKTKAFIQTQTTNNEIRDIETFQIDLTNNAEIKKLAQQLQNTDIDILINNAGIGAYSPIQELDDATWELSLNLNVTAPFLLTKYFLKNLENATTRSGQKSVILNIGSGCGIVGVKDRVAYCATKFALRGMSFSLHEELKDKVNVIYLTLGSVATNFGGISAKEKMQSTKKKYLTPQEVADFIWEKVITNKNGDLPAELELYPKGYFATLGKTP